MKNIGGGGGRRLRSGCPSREGGSARSGTLGNLIKEKLGDKLDETLKR